MMKKPFIILFAAIGLSACGETVQTVEWYKEHEAERKEMIAKCKNDVNARDTNSNCLNAEQAQISLEGARRGWIKPKVPTFD